MNIFNRAYNAFSGRTAVDKVNRASFIYFCKLRKHRSPLSLRVDQTAAVVHHRNTQDDLFGIWQCFHRHQYEIPTPFFAPPEHRIAADDFYQSLIAQNRVPLIVDCGANIGASAVWFAARYPAAHIVAVEPAPSNLAILEKNSAGRSIDVINGAVTDNDGRLNLVDTGSTLSNRVQTDADPSERTYSVEGYSIRSVMDNASRQAVPFILKVDIEGAEKAVFSSCLEDIAQFPIIIVEPHDFMLPGQSTVSSFLAFHAARQRDFLFFEENIFSVDLPACVLSQRLQPSTTDQRPCRVARA